MCVCVEGGGEREGGNNRLLFSGNFCRGEAVMEGDKVMIRDPPLGKTLVSAAKDHGRTFESKVPLFAALSIHFIFSQLFQ